MMMRWMKMSRNPMTRGLLFCLILALSSVFITACGDDYTDEAKKFDAVEALDDGDWEAARNILNSLPTDADVLEYLSNCDAGEVGINTFDLLTTIDELDGNNESGSIDMIGKLIGTDGDNLSCAVVADKLDLIINAIDLLDDIFSLTGNALTDGQKTQLALASITRTVLIIATLICEKTGDDSIQMTQAWLEANKGDVHPILPGSWDAEYGAMMGEDMDNVDDAIAVLDSNDIQDDFEEFRSDLDNGAGVPADANDGTITLAELNAYLDTF